MMIALRRSSAEPGGGEPDDHGVVPGEHQVDHDDLEERGQERSSERWPVPRSRALAATLATGGPCQPMRGHVAAEEPVETPGEERRRSGRGEGARPAPGRAARSASGRCRPAGRRRAARGCRRASRPPRRRRGRRRIVGEVEAVGQHPGVLERHRRPLGEEGQHRMAGVAEERERGRRPRRGAARGRRAPEEAVLDGGEERARRPAPAGEGAAERRRIVAADQPSAVQAARSSTATRLTRLPPRSG